MNQGTVANQGGTFSSCLPCICYIPRYSRNFQILVVHCRGVALPLTLKLNPSNGVRCGEVYDLSGPTRRLLLGLRDIEPSGVSWEVINRPIRRIIPYQSINTLLMANSRCRGRSATWRFSISRSVLDATMKTHQREDCELRFHAVDPLYGGMYCTVFKGT
jgi:hypothetical protein